MMSNDGTSDRPRESVDLRKTMVEPEGQYDLRSTLVITPPLHAELPSAGLGGERPMPPLIPVPLSPAAKEGVRLDAGSIQRPPVPPNASNLRGTMVLPASYEETPSAPLNFRPKLRPPTAVLKILDDNQQTGELVRLRSDRTVIGRSEGEVRIPHDERISSSHAELVRTGDGKGWIWHLNDLESTNGTFVLVEKARLNHDDEVLIGAFRYRFSARPQAELICLENNSRYSLSSTTENLIGRSGIGGQSNDLLEASHAQISLNSAGRWCLQDLASRNGVWVRVRRVRLAGQCTFQLGEQRFLFGTI